MFIQPPRPFRNHLANKLRNQGQSWQEFGPKGEALPYGLQFQSIYQSGWHQYTVGQFDEAIRKTPDFARIMRNDAFLGGLFAERKLGTSSLVNKWELEVENEREPAQKAMKDGLTTWMKKIPRFQAMIWYLLEALWYGRYGSQHVYEHKTLMLPDLADPTRRVPFSCPVMKSHSPVDGDSIVHKFDGTPCILVNGAWVSDIPGIELVPSTNGRSAVLEGNWPNRFLIHRHELLAGSYMDPLTAERAFGTGLRSSCYYWQWMKMEFLGNVTDWATRIGLGVRIWKYESGNKKSLDEVKAAATAMSNKTDIFVPVAGGSAGRAVEGVEFLTSSGTGADLLLRLCEYMDDIITRLIIGQSMSGGADMDGGLGGTGRAELAADTKGKIIQFDVVNLAETLTELVERAKRWIYPPEYWDIPVWFRFKIETEDPDKVIESAIKAYEHLGVDFTIPSIRSQLPLEAPQHGDETVSQAMQARQEQQMQAQQAMQPQMPGQQPQAAPQEQQPPPDNEDFVKNPEMSPEDEQWLNEYWQSQGNEPQQFDKSGLATLPPEMDSPAFRTWDQATPVQANRDIFPLRPFPGGEPTAPGMPSPAQTLTNPQQSAPAGMPSGGLPKTTSQEEVSTEPGIDKPKEPKPRNPVQIHPEVWKAASGVLGRDVSHDDLHNLVGAQDGFRTESFVKNGSTVINTFSDDDRNVNGSYMLFNRPDDTGKMKKTLHTAWIGIGQSGKGLGTDMFAKQVEHAQKMGVDQLDLNAARGKSPTGEDMIGYNYWPKLGFNAPLDGRHVWKMPMSMKWQWMTGKLRTVQDLMRTPEGQAWWKENGDSVNMTFDMTPGSESNKVLSAYLARKKGGSGQVQKARGGEPIRYSRVIRPNPRRILTGATR